MLMLFKKHLNMLIDNVNQLSQIVENIDTNFTDIYNKIDTINLEIAEINQNFVDFENRINQNVEYKMQQFYSQVLSLMSDYQNIFEYELNSVKTELENQIEDVELGNVIAYNPTTGGYDNVSQVIMDVYETLRQNAVTCTEFDGLELSATEYDALEITAYNFDVNGKTFLNVE